MSDRNRILLLAPHLGGGGAEHVMALLARNLSREKYEVHLGLVQQGEATGDVLPPWVAIHPLGARRARAAAFPLLRLVWRLRPHVILTSAIEVSFLVLLLRPYFPRKTCILVRQNATLSSLLSTGSLPQFARWLCRILYRQSDRVICQSLAMARDLEQTAGIGQERITVLPNPVDLDAIRAAACTPSVWQGPGPHLLAVGRLSQEKGIDLLLLALAHIRQQYPCAGLIVAGAGREEAALKALCSELGLDTAVRFAGHVDNPYTLFAGATLFVLPSRHEGMPNALLEAAAAGLPLVVTPASGGVVDLLQGKKGAWIAPEISANALASTILVALDSLQDGERFVQPFLSAQTSSSSVDPSANSVLQQK